MTRSRNAFTLVELLVVIAIIGIIAAMTVPAVMHTIELARRTNCSKNMQQLAFGAIGHEARKGRLPGALELIGGKQAPWAVAILPDIENQTLYDRWADSNVSFTSVDRPYIGLFSCPSAPGQDTQVASNSYIANLGFAPRAADPSPFSISIAPSPPTSGYDYWEAHRKANGPFVDRYTARVNGWNVGPELTTVTTANFKDGMGNTILFSENLVAGEWHVTGLPTGMVWLYANESGVPVNQGYATGMVLPPSAIPTVAKINGDKNTLASVTSPEHARPSSMHSSGVNVALADGSVRFLSEKIAYHVYQALLTLDDARSDMPYRRIVLSAGDY